jgi:hypothetical protein
MPHSPRLPWYFLVVLDPAEALDWYDHRAKPPRLDHAKVVPDLVLAVMVLLQVIWSLRTGQLPGIWYLIVDLSAAFGHAAWRQFLARVSYTGSTAETTIKTETRAIVEERMASDGTFQATP